MANYITTDTELTSIANAIRTKGGTSATLTYPAGFVSAIENIPTGGGGGDSGTGYDVVFYDDLANNGKGGIAAHYSASEFTALSAMPANPDHSDYTNHGISIPMTSQGWNWSLADAKTYVAKYGKLNIGQMYVPTDGKSHYICYVPTDAPVERWNTVIHISTTGNGVEWQIDNGELNSATGNIDVTFPSTGWHDVKIQAKTGATYYPYYSASSKSNELVGKLQKITSVYLGNNITSIGNDSFQKFYSLRLITIPTNVTNIGTNSFMYCYTLTSVTIPNDVTSIGNSAFSNCHSLVSATIPVSVTSIGSSLFNFCHSLASITIPTNVTNIGISLFASCYSLASITIPNGVTSIGNSAFSSCYSLASITIPDGVTSIGSSVFSSLRALASITIPANVRSIGNSAFTSCYSLTSVTIPANVTKIEANAFSTGCSIKNIIMLSSTPPTLSNTNAFNGLMSDYSIIVPSGSKSTYIAATNWSSLADHIVEAT